MSSNNVDIPSGKHFRAAHTHTHTQWLGKRKGKKYTQKKRESEGAEEIEKKNEQKLYDFF